MKYVIAPNEVSNWCGPPGTGKSALVGDLCLHICAGMDWRGFKSKKQGAVLYCALERADLVERRFNAQAAQYGIDPKQLPFHIVGLTIDMLATWVVDKFVATIRAVEEVCGVAVILLVVDTSAKAIAAGGGDENHARDKNIVRANARRVMEIVEGLHVALIGHTGKDVERGERGSNAGLGDDDLLVILNKSVADVLKRNDGPEGPLTNYRIIPILSWSARTTTART
jgi:RecA-family ATPase